MLHLHRARSISVSRHYLCFSTAQRCRNKLCSDGHLLLLFIQIYIYNSILRIMGKTRVILLRWVNLMALILNNLYIRRRPCTVIIYVSHLIWLSLCRMVIFSAHFVVINQQTIVEWIRKLCPVSFPLNAFRLWLGILWWRLRSLLLFLIYQELLPLSTVSCIYCLFIDLVINLVCELAVEIRLVFPLLFRLKKFV